MIVSDSQSNLQSQQLSDQNQLQFFQESGGTLAFSHLSDTSPYYNPIESTPMRKSGELRGQKMDLNSGEGVIRSAGPGGLSDEENAFRDSTGRKLQESDIVNVEGGMYSDYKGSSSRMLQVGRKIEQNLNDNDEDKVDNQILRESNQNGNFDYSQMNLNYDSVFSDKTNHQRKSSKNQLLQPSTSPTIQNTNHFQRKKASMMTAASHIKSPLSYKRNLHIDDLKLTSDFKLNQEDDQFSAQKQKRDIIYERDQIQNSKQIRSDKKSEIESAISRIEKFNLQQDIQGLSIIENINRIINKNNQRKDSDCSNPTNQSNQISQMSIGNNKLATSSGISSNYHNYEQDMKLKQELELQRLQNEKLSEQNQQLLDKMNKLMQQSQISSQNEEDVTNPNLQSQLTQQIQEPDNFQSVSQFNAKNIQIYTDEEDEKIETDNIEQESLRVKQVAFKNGKAFVEGKRVTSTSNGLGFRRASYVNESSHNDSSLPKGFTRNNSQKMNLTTNQPGLSQSSQKNNQYIQDQKTIHTNQLKGTNFTFCHQCNNSTSLCQNDQHKQQFNSQPANSIEQPSSNLSKKLVSLKKMAFSPTKVNMQIDTKIGINSNINIGPKTTQGLPPHNNQKPLSNASSQEKFAKTTKNLQFYNNVPQQSSGNKNSFSQTQKLSFQNSNSLPPSSINSARQGSNLRGINIPIKNLSKLNSGQNSAKNIQNRRTSSTSNFHEKNYIRSMLQNSVLSSSEDKIDFLVSEIETANTKISILQDHLANFMNNKSSFIQNQTNLQTPQSTSSFLPQSSFHQRKPSQESQFPTPSQPQPLLEQCRQLLQEKADLESQFKSLSQEKIQLQNDLTTCKEENQHLRNLITARTEEANQTIIKLMNSNSEIKKKNEEFLVLIEQLSNEILKSNQQAQHLQTQNQSLQVQQQQMIALIQQLSNQNASLSQRGGNNNSNNINNQKQNISSQINQDDYDKLKQENLQLNADLKAVRTRLEEIAQEKNVFETKFKQEVMLRQSLQEQIESKDETIKKLKKKIVSSYIKEKIWNNQQTQGQDDEDIVEQEINQLSNHESQINNQNEPKNRYKVSKALNPQIEKFQQQQKQQQQQQYNQQNFQNSMFSPSSTMKTQINEDQFCTVNSENSSSTYGMYSANRSVLPGQGHYVTNNKVQFNSNDFSLISAKSTKQ